MTSARTIDRPKSTAPFPAPGHAISTIAASRRRRAECAKLRHMTDHQLRDIGLTRGEANAIAIGIHASVVEHGPATREDTAVRRAGRALMSAMRWLRVRYEHHRAMRALMALNDRELKDIGLHRGGIADAVRTGGDRTPVTATG